MENYIREQFALLFPHCDCVEVEFADGEIINVWVNGELWTFQCGSDDDWFVFNSPFRDSIVFPVPEEDL